MSKTQILEVKELDKAYSGKKVVNNLEIDLSSGECFVLLGPNGAGKTTTIKMIAGLSRMDKGSIIVGGKSVSEDPVITKSLIGYIPDDPYTYPYLSGRQIIEYMADLRGISRSKLDTSLKDLLKYYPINDVMNKRFSDYSRGNKQKIMIIAAMIHDPKLLLVDEPVVGLDTESQISTKELFDSYLEKGGAIFMSTHTLDFAEKVADKVGLIDKGKMIKTFDSNKVKDNKLGDLQKKYLEVVNKKK